MNMNIGICQRCVEESEREGNDDVERFGYDTLKQHIELREEYVEDMVNRDKCAHPDGLKADKCVYMLEQIVSQNQDYEPVL